MAVFDLCPTSESVIQLAPSTYTGRDSGFLAGRRSSSRSLRLFDLAFDNVPRALWDDVLLLYRSTYGGASRVTYTPRGSSTPASCRFSRRPTRATVTTGASVSFVVRLEEVGV